MRQCENTRWFQVSLKIHYLLSRQFYYLFIYSFYVFFFIVFPRTLKNECIELYTSVFVLPVASFPHLQLAGQVYSSEPLQRW